MPRISDLFRSAGLFVLLVMAGTVYSPAASLPSTGLQGKVKSADGKSMEGVAVSAHIPGKTITTSVYTDTDGNYYFPPLPEGQYLVWAQAVGFQKAHAEPAVTSGKKIQQNFTMTAMPDFHMQLSSTDLIL